jgi:hypothetical protein
MMSLRWSVLLTAADRSKVTIHCTVIGPMMGRRGYIEDFVRIWSAREETKRIWISLFTPQQGAVAPGILTPDERRRVTEDLLRLRVPIP